MFEGVVYFVHPVFVTTGSARANPADLSVVTC